MIKYIRKRNGCMELFDENKITEAILKAFQATEFYTSHEIPYQLCQQVQNKLTDRDVELPTVELIQDLVEETLIENGYVKASKAYILYREEHNRQRCQADYIKMDMQDILENNLCIDSFIIPIPKTVTSFFSSVFLWIEYQKHSFSITHFDTSLKKIMDQTYQNYYISNLKKVLQFIGNNPSEQIIERIQTANLCFTLENQDYQEKVDSILQSYSLSSQYISFIKDFVLMNAYQETKDEFEHGMALFLEHLSLNLTLHKRECYIEYGDDHSFITRYITSFLQKDMLVGIEEKKYSECLKKVFVHKK